jgi:hypothetical protein
VDAALVGFDRRELVTIPPVPDVAVGRLREGARRFGGRLQQFQAGRALSALTAKVVVVAHCFAHPSCVEAELVALERHPEIRLEFAPT